MDDLLPPCYPPCFTSPFSAADGHRQNPAPEFLSCDALEKWLLGNDDVLDNHDGEDPQDHTGSSLLPPPAAAVAPRKRGRKPGYGSRAAGTTAAIITHMEAERLRRDRLNRLLCDLRAAVPAVTGMDRASLLADAVGYITTLRGRVKQLEAEAEARRPPPASLPRFLPMLFGGGGSGHQELEVRMHGRDAAALRLTTTTTTVAARHAPARLMAALRALDLPVQCAGVCRVGGVTVQDVVVDVPAAAAAGLRGDDDYYCLLRAALLHKLLQESG